MLVVVIVGFIVRWCIQCWMLVSFFVDFLYWCVIVWLFILYVGETSLVLVLVYVIVCADFSWWILVMCVWLCLVICGYWNTFLVDQSSYNSAFLNLDVMVLCLLVCFGDC